MSGDGKMVTGMTPSTKAPEEGIGFSYSRTRLLIGWLVALGFGGVCVLLQVVHPAMSVEFWVASTSLLVIGACMYQLAKQSRHRGPVLLISPNGITDHRMGVGIRWEEIVDVAVTGKVVSVKVEDPERFIQPRYRIMRPISRFMTWAFAVEAVQLPISDLHAGPWDVQQAINTFRPAPEPERVRDWR